MSKGHVLYLTTSFTFEYKPDGTREKYLSEAQKAIFYIEREKGRDLTKSYDKSPYTHRKNPKSNVTT